MKNDEKKMKNRTLRWSAETDEYAVQLATEKGYYPEKANGGVSRMLSDMVVKEAGGRPLKKPVAAVVLPTRTPSTARRGGVQVITGTSDAPEVRRY